MSGSRNLTGIARNLLIGLAILLLGGIAGSLFLGAHAAASQKQRAVDQARDIADRSLGLVFRPEDLPAPVSQARAQDLTDRVTAVVLDPSDFDTVTLWSPDGQIIYSTDEGRIGNTLDGERDPIREAIRGRAQTSITDGDLSILLPFELRSGVGDPVAVELTTSAEDVTSAPAPWRTNALFLTLLLGVVGVVLYRSGRPVPRFTAQPPRTGLTAAPTVPSPPSRPITVPTPGLREEADARHKAEDRARAAEERLSVLQDQYRNTLEELQLSERRNREQATASRPDQRTQERLAQAEQRARDHEVRARELEGRLRTLSTEHEELARVAPDLDAITKANERLAQLTMQRDDLKRERDALVSERDELTAQRAELNTQLDAGPATVEDPELLRRAQQAETEAIGLRAELDGAQTQLSMARRELETLRIHVERGAELQEDLDAAHVEALHAREAQESAQSQLDGARTELEDARGELRALRTEEQRAAMLADELRASRAELESLAASHRAELVEREADLEDKVRSVRERFQSQIAAVDDQHREALAVRDAELAERTAGVQDAAAAELESLRRELADRDARYGSAEAVIALAKDEVRGLSAELTQSRAELDATVAQLLDETASVRNLNERVSSAERDASEAARNAAKLAADLDDATQDNADLNRRLQELEARRALEIADAEGRTNLDELLRVTQERLAGQTEKLIAAEDRVHQMQREMAMKLEQIDQVEAELRHQQMAEAMRQIRGEAHEAAVGAETDDTVTSREGPPLEDRRATTPFMQELSLDAKRSLMQILGLTQILKHKKDAKEQSQLVRQLTTYARRLDHVVADMADADKLVHGTIELTVRRTDLEALVKRVVEESGVDADHEVIVKTERVTVAIDQLRTEQILAGLLRSANDRTPARKPITVRLQSRPGGAMISVEDPEPSSDASLSPVVRRFAEVQSGTVSVESRPEGGSAFTVFLPDGAREPDDSDMEVGEPDPTDLHIVVDDEAPSTDDDWAPTEEQMLVQELHRLSELTAED